MLTTTSQSAGSLSSACLDQPSHLNACYRPLYKFIFSTLIIYRYCSQLSAIPIRPPQMKSLSVFYNKVLKGFLKVSSYASSTATYFLLGQLPVEALAHIGVLSLFHNITCNPQTTLHGIIKYILMMSSDSSVTWSNHVRILCKRYSLPCPLTMLESPAVRKEDWMTLVKTNIMSWFEKDLRKSALLKPHLKYINVQLLGLSGRPHPSLQYIWTTQDVKKARVHIKFLIGDLPSDLTSENCCQIDKGQRCMTEHILAICPKYKEVRQRVLPDLLNIVLSVQPTCRLLREQPPDVLTQFLLDCTSLNLQDDYRIPAQNPGVPLVFACARDWCFAIASIKSRK